MFEVHGKYLYYKDGFDEEPDELEFQYMMKYNRESVAVFKHGNKAVWLYESKWKYLKKV